MRIFLSLAVLLLFAAPALAQDKQRPPNIVFIIADDLGVQDLGCYGRKDHHTPNLDRLAKQGMRFTTAYSAQSVCSPTRAAIMTGKTPARLHLTTFLPGRTDAPSQMLLHPKINQELPKGEWTIANFLRTVGYVCAVIGKWHLGGKGCLPTDRGFDSYFEGRAKTEPSATEAGKGEYQLTAEAIKFMEKNKDRPFFLYLAHNNPHIPLVARPELMAKHKDAFNPTYAAMIETLDDCVGLILAKLDELKLSENTIVVFTSDNGGLHVIEGPSTPATFCRPFRGGKGWCYEGGHRIPLVVRWPAKVKADQINDTPVISTDWTPTFLEAAGIKTDKTFDGVSLVGLLTGKELGRRSLFWHQPHYTNQGGRPAGAVRHGPMKLIENYETGACELYDLASDPGEQNDLSKRHAATVAHLRGELEQWRREVGAQEMTANPAFRAALAKKLYRDIDISLLPPADKATTLAKQLTAWQDTMGEAIAKKPAVEPGVGAFILHARDAKVHGTKLRYEKEALKDTLGFWVDKNDWVEWTFEVPRAGRFEVELLQGSGTNNGGSEVEIAVKDQKLTYTVIDTAHFQHFVPRTAGTVTLEAGRHTLSVRVLSKASNAVMDLRRVVLRAAE